MTGLLRDDVGVSPIIGTILTFAIVVAGLGGVMFLGAPMIARLQDQAALEGVTGQFQVVRNEASRLNVANASVSPGLSLNGGTMSIVGGTRVLVTVFYEPACDLRLRSWADGDATLSFTYTGFPVPAAPCRMPAKDGPIPDLALTPFVDEDIDRCYRPPPLLLDLTGCIEVLALSNGIPGGQNLAASTGGGDPCNGPLGCTTGRITLTQAIQPDTEYRMRLTGGSSVFWEAWLLRMGRLAWLRTSSGGGAEAVFEGGALFARSAGQTFLAGEPFVQEINTTPPQLFLNLPTWQDSTSGAVAGAGAHSVTVTYDEGHVRVLNQTAQRLHLDFHGDLAPAWCRAFLQRSGGDSDPYEEVPDILLADVGHQCNPTGAPNADRIRGLAYDPTTGPFQFTLTQQVLHARLN